MRTYLRILGYGSPLGWTIPKYLILIIPASVFSVVNLAVLVPLLQLLFDSNETNLVYDNPSFTPTLEYFKSLFYYHLTGLIHTKGKIFALYFIGAVAISSVFLSNLFRYLSQLVVAQLRIKVIKKLRKELFDKVISLDIGYFTEHRKGDIMSRITMDVAEVEQSVVTSLKALFREPLMIAGYFVALFSMSPQLTVYTLMLLPLSGALISMVSKKLKRSAKKSQEALSLVNSTLDESLGAIRIIKAFAAGPYIRNKFHEIVDRFAHYNFRMAARSNLAAPISEFLGITVLSLLLLIGGSMVLQAEPPLSAAQFIGFLLIFAQVLNPIKAISAAFGSISRAVASGERIFELMDKKPKASAFSEKQSVRSFEHSIRFRNVNFSYDHNPVLKNVSLEIPKGKVVALIGPSGSGKSTVADLILRFYGADEGEILLDGHPIASIRSADYNQLIGLVSQQTILFNDTVANNISFGKPTATRKEIIAAAKVACAHEFILDLDDGYDTPIGEQGNKLSGGQRQRLSIARAILKNPPILVLDEATSSLDSESELLVRNAVTNLMKDRTVLVITHRLNIVQTADEILTIADGRIIQHGTHESLMDSDGLYKKLLELQSF